MLLFSSVFIFTLFSLYLLSLGFVGSRSIHVLVALCKEHIRIITTYEPDAAKWVDYRFRKKEGK